MRLVKLGAAVINVVNETKPFIEELLGVPEKKTNPAPSYSERATSDDSWARETQNVKCQRCNSSVVIGEAIRVDVPDEDLKFFDTALCLLRWVRDVV